jgi:glucose-6-phosphate 1-epimerase
VIPKELLDRIPAAARGIACVCAQCVRAAASPRESTAAGCNAPMDDSLPAGITRATDPGGRPALRLQRDDDVVLVSFVGAQVLSWHHRGRDVLWTASKAEYLPGKPVRGGIPVVFPWFGDHPTDPRQPAHGFVRNQTWRLAAAAAGPEITLATSDDATTRSTWPHEFGLQLRIWLDAGLHVELTIENRTSSPLPCEEALHTYFAVGDVHTASVHGLEGVAVTEFAREPETGWDDRTPIRFRAETDRVFQGVPDRIELRTPGLGGSTALQTRNARSAIVWNPWPAKTARLSQMVADDWQRFVCIESANVKQQRLHLAPGALHTMALSLTRA